MLKVIESIANKYNAGMKKEELIRRVYHDLVNSGIKAAILNNRYLIVDGQNYQIRKKAGQFSVSTF